MASAHDPLFLQVKQARPSVLEAYAGKSLHANHGQRIVHGCRMMQSASDMFLGWVTGRTGRCAYVRQLRDAKVKPLVEAMDAEILREYADACGWVLARAHAKVSDADLQRSAAISARQTTSSIKRWSSSPLRTQIRLSRTMPPLRLPCALAR